MACFRMGFVNLLLSVHSLVADFRNCAGFSDAGMTMPTTRTVAGVREAPRHEIAGSGHRRCGVRYGDYMSGGTVKPDFLALFTFIHSFVRPAEPILSSRP